MLTILIVSCTTSRKTNQISGSDNSSINAEHDGSSYENAVVIKEKTETSGVKAEYAWLSKNYPGYTFKEQSLGSNNKKPYDIITIVTTDGEKKKIYFDISNFYGKL